MMGVPVNVTEFLLADKETNDTMNVIYLQTPEDMLVPWNHNDFFWEIVITHAITFFIGITGNITVITVMAGIGKSRTATNLFLVSLAVADLLLLLVCVPLQTMQYFVLQWSHVSEHICNVAQFAHMLSPLASILNLCAVTCERYLVIVYPMKSRSFCTISNCRKAMLVVWTVAILLSTPALTTKKINPYTFWNNATTVTIHYCEDKDSPVSLYFAIYQLFILFILPGLSMLYCYSYVIKELWKSSKNITNLTSDYRLSQGPDSCALRAAQFMLAGGSCATRPQMTYSADNLHRCVCDLDATNSYMCLMDKVRYSRSLSWQTLRVASPRPSNSYPNGIVRKHFHNTVKKSRRQVIKMLLLVIVLFLVCWGPTLVLQVILKCGIKYYSPAMYQVRVTMSLLPFIHACLNPFIYSFMSKNFRRSLLGCYGRGAHYRDARRFSDTRTQSSVHIYGTVSMNSCTRITLPDTYSRYSDQIQVSVM